MANENDVKAAPVAVKQAAKTGGKPSGIIAYNKFLDTWRAVDASNRTVLTGSKAVLVDKFPNFLVKE